MTVSNQILKLAIFEKITCETFQWKTCLSYDKMIHSYDNDLRFNCCDSCHQKDEEYMYNEIMYFCENLSHYYEKIIQSFS